MRAVATGFEEHDADRTIIQQDAPDEESYGEGSASPTGVLPKPWSQWLGAPFLLTPVADISKRLGIHLILTGLVGSYF